MALDTAPGMKACTRCRTAKPVEEFYSHVKAKDGLQSWCKDCTKEHLAGWALDNPVAARVATTRQKARRRALKKGIPFNLSQDDLMPIPTHCPVLGIPMEFGDTDGYNNSPSLDRINPELGYVPGNVRWISFRANVLRRDASVEELLLVTRDALELAKEAADG